MTIESRVNHYNSSKSIYSDERLYFPKCNHGLDDYESLVLPHTKSREISSSICAGSIVLTLHGSALGAVISQGMPFLYSNLISALSGFAVGAVTVLALRGLERKVKKRN